jgi:predicted nuclease with TOPRIM domain
MKGLGRGKGFEVTGEYSALGDVNLTSRINERVKKIENITSVEPEREQQVELKITESQYNMILDREEELEDEVAYLRRKLRQEQGKVADLQDRLEEIEDSESEILEKINDAIGEIYHEEFDDVYSAVDALLEEYHDLLEETEDQVT